MVNVVERTYLDTFIRGILQTKPPSKFSYDIFPWPLYSQAMLHPVPRLINEVKLPMFSKKLLKEQLISYALSTIPTELNTLERSSTPNSPKNIAIFQSKIESGHLLKVTFVENNVHDLSLAHSIICLIMGSEALAAYQAQLPNQK